MSRAPAQGAVDGDAWRRAADAGVHRITLPTPFSVGTVNCYLIEDEPLTLLDTGPNSGTALDALETTLATLGHRIEDVGLVLLSHEHIDHMGLASIVARRSGAEVAALDSLADYLRDYEASADAVDDFAVEMMLRHGVAEETAAALRTVTASFRGWGAPASVDRRLADGERIALAGRSLEVCHRPGHSPTDTVFFDADRRIALCADHLLAHISSNALLAPPPPGSSRRPRALVDYVRSLLATKKMPAELLLTGHGEPVTAHRELIDKRLDMHERRARKLLGSIRARAATAHALAGELWGRIALTQAFLTLSEVIGHLDLLIEAGLVAEKERDGIVVFEASGASGVDLDEPLALIAASTGNPLDKQG